MVLQDKERNRTSFLRIDLICALLLFLLFSILFSPNGWLTGILKAFVFSVGYFLLFGFIVIRRNKKTNQLFEQLASKISKTETLICNGPASYINNKKVMNSGWLFLTKNEIVYYVGENKTCSIPLKNIISTAVENGKLMITDATTTHVFAVFYADTWKAEIHKGIDMKDDFDTKIECVEKRGKTVEKKIIFRKKSTAVWWALFPLGIAVYFIAVSFIEDALSLMLDLFWIPLLLVLIAGFLYWMFAGMEIVVTNKRVYGKVKFGVSVDLPLDSISAVMTTSFTRGVSISTSSGRISFFYITDREEIAGKIRELLIERQDKNVPQTTIMQHVLQSNADELKKYKDLLDGGVISQEEFDAKKKQLLGL